MGQLRAGAMSSRGSFQPGALPSDLGGGRNAFIMATARDANIPIAPLLLRALAIMTLVVMVFQLQHAHEHTAAAQVHVRRDDHRQHLAVPDAGMGGRSAVTQLPAERQPGTAAESQPTGDISSRVRRGAAELSVMADPGMPPSHVSDHMPDDRVEHRDQGDQNAQMGLLPSVIGSHDSPGSDALHAMAANASMAPADHQSGGLPESSRPAPQLALTEHGAEPPSSQEPHPIASGQVLRQPSRPEAYAQLGHHHQEKRDAQPARVQPKTHLRSASAAGHGRPRADGLHRERKQRPPVGAPRSGNGAHDPLDVVPGDEEAGVGEQDLLGSRGPGGVAAQGAPLDIVRGPESGLFQGHFVLTSELPVGTRLKFPRKKLRNTLTHYPIGQITPDLSAHLPPTDFLRERGRKGSCAVVGNGGTLLLYNLGPEIDFHDMVIRLNSGPAGGFERHVGAKTGVRLVNRAHIGYREAETERVLQHVSTAEALKQFLELQKKRDPPQAPVSMISMDFHEHAYQYTDKGVLSNGMYAVLLASEVCETVTVYGFLRQWRGRVHYHYYNKEEPDEMQSKRDTKEEERIVQFMNDRAATHRHGEPCMTGDATAADLPAGTVHVGRSVPAGSGTLSLSQASATGAAIQTGPGSPMWVAYASAKIPCSALADCSTACAHLRCLHPAATTEFLGPV
eukprot:CAMPEP_0117647828 /NCGR_PEP_ID=MMETSP0804-20121206/56_1 /TAXON_ID=1074897 /ORGANISM="Tetraselmis astigmatica, Strain CCMP880" /LENGTH=678 /DNA_ID=CAMNT_0005453343 /DNA_START=400 /DNA_END=2436 /DNA_ORIENTATION=-